MATTFAGKAAVLQRLQIFRSVADAKGFAPAQPALNMSAAAISVKMKDLEMQLGMVLCRRGRSGFKLTERGQKVYEAMQPLFSAFDNFGRDVAAIRNELAGEVRIGLQDNLATDRSFRLSEAIAAFSKRKNSVSFHVEEAPASEQASRTLEGRYDLSIGLFRQRLPGLQYTKLFTEEAALYCGSKHPLFRKTEFDVSLADLRRAEWVVAEPIHQLLNAKDLAGRAAAIVENMDATVILLLSGRYVGYLPKDFADIWVRNGRLKPLLYEKTRRAVDFYLITRAEAQQPLVVKIFLKDLLASHAITRRNELNMAKS
jgi:DNA-binding transcriptional LysR family regulator